MPKIIRRRADRIKIKNKNRSNAALLCAFLLCAALLFFDYSAFSAVVCAKNGGHLKVKVVTEKQDVQIIPKGHIHKEANGYYYGKLGLLVLGHVDSGYEFMLEYGL